MTSPFVIFECPTCHHGYVRQQTGTNRVMPYCPAFGLLVPDELLIPTCGACGETFQNEAEVTEMARQQVALLSRLYAAVDATASGYAMLRGFEDSSTPGEFDEAVAADALDEFHDFSDP